MVGAPSSGTDVTQKIIVHKLQIDGKSTTGSKNQSICNFLRVRLILQNMEEIVLMFAVAQCEYSLSP